MPDVSPAGTRRLEIETGSTSQALAAVKKRPYTQSATIFGQSIHLLMEESVSPSEVESDLRREGFADVHLREIRPTLEDVFVTLTNAMKEEIDEGR